MDTSYQVSKSKLSSTIVSFTIHGLSKKHNVLACTNTGCTYSDILDIKLLLKKNPASTISCARMSCPTNNIKEKYSKIKYSNIKCSKENKVSCETNFRA